MNLRKQPLQNGISLRVAPETNPGSSVSLSFRVLFPDNFKWAVGGALPGVVGGEGNCSSSKTSTDPTCWFAQLGWRAKGRGKVSTRMATGGKKGTIERTEFQWRLTDWNDVTVDVRTNSVDAADGFLRVTVNGAVVTSFEDATFYPGGGAPAAAVLLEARYNKGKVPKKTSQVVKIDNLQIKAAEFAAPPAKSPPVVPSPRAVAPSPPPPSPVPVPMLVPEPTPVPTVPVEPSVPGGSDFVTTPLPEPTPPTPTPTTPPATGGGGGSESSDVTPDQLRRIVSLTSIFENSDTTLQYGYCEDIGDGRGYTFGFCGFTTATEDAVAVVEDFIARRPNDNPLAPFLPTMQQLSKRSSSKTSGLDGFCEAVAALGADPDFRASQDSIQKSWYLDPAMKWAREAGVKLGTTRGQIYDAMINHGEGPEDNFSIDHIFEETNRAAGGTPATGVDELTWLNKFLDVREGILQKEGGDNSARRISFYRALLDAGNIHMDGPIYVDTVRHADGWTITNVYYGTFEIYSAKPNHKWRIVA